MSTRSITELLQEWRQGDRAALEELTPAVYRELRKIAGGQMRRERVGHTLQPTALINEAYVRLSGDSVMEWQNRAHFFATATNVMRRILVEYARSRHSQKRQGGMRITLCDGALFSSERPEDMIQLDDALQALAQVDERKARVVELRYFGGLSIEEIAEVVGISVATVGRELRFAQAWLANELGAPSISPPSVAAP